MSRMLSLFQHNAAPRRMTATTFTEALVHLGDGHADAERYRQARRSYGAALRVEPYNAGLWLKLAAAWESDPYGSDERAFKCYRRAVKHDAGNAIALARLARCGMRVRREVLAKRMLARAVALAPADAGVLAIAAETCREAGWTKRAGKWLNAARFLAPHSGAIRALWNRHRYDGAAKKKTTGCGTRATLPFLRIAGESWRHDSPAI